MTGDGFPRSAVVYGTGLMGSSFALALKQSSPGIPVYGVDKPETLQHARQLGIVDSKDPPSAQPADLAILAAPVGAILKLIDELPMGPRLIVDVGSTKVEICRRAERRGLPFVGGHPMTGSERSGPDAASPELFRNAPFFLCSIPTTPPEGISDIMTIVKSIGGVPHMINPEAHDRMVAQLSHLPQILSTLLADQTSEPRNLAGPGWKSVTRLAASPFHVWRDILETSGCLPQELESFVERLESVIQILKAGNIDDLNAVFERANRSASGGGRE